MVVTLVKLCLASCVLANGALTENERPHRLALKQHRPHMLNQKPHHNIKETVQNLDTFYDPECSGSSCGQLHLRAQRESGEAQTATAIEAATTSTDDARTATAMEAATTANDAAAPAPPPGPGGPADFSWAEKMDVSKGLPSQGFEGDMVKHVDKDTMIEDWHKERKPAASMCKICEHHIANPWCHRKCPHVREMWLRSMKGKRVGVHGWSDGTGAHGHHGHGEIHGHGGHGGHDSEQEGVLPPGMNPGDGEMKGPAGDVLKDAGDVLHNAAAAPSALLALVPAVALLFLP